MALVGRQKPGKEPSWRLQKAEARCGLRPERGDRQLAERAVREYDRGRGLEGDEGAGRTRGVYAEPLAWFFADDN
jgi:hypothetical protein